MLSRTSLRSILFHVIVLSSRKNERAKDRCKIFILKFNSIRWAFLLHVSLQCENYKIVSSYLGINRSYAWDCSFNSERGLRESPRNATADSCSTCKCYAKVYITYPRIHYHYSSYRRWHFISRNDMNVYLSFYSTTRSWKKERSLSWQLKKWLHVLFFSSLRNQHFYLPRHIYLVLLSQIYVITINCVYQKNLQYNRIMKSHGASIRRTGVRRKETWPIHKFYAHFRYASTNFTLVCAAWCSVPAFTLHTLIEMYH